MTQLRKRMPRTPKEAAGSCGPIDDALDVELFRGLADPTRLQLLGCLAKCRRPCSVGELAECCRVDLSVVSRHLAQLARAGVLETSKDGRTVYYAVRYAEVAAKLRSLADAIEGCAPARGTKAGACCDKC